MLEKTAGRLVAQLECIIDNEIEIVVDETVPPVARARVLIKTKKGKIYNVGWIIDAARKVDPLMGLKIDQHGLWLW